ncbi:hypothetical protein [Streptomyces canus]|uniref:hypothetical protein n=1 Tax=Streptomyces canus TaxID=58343 RepID=UPI0027881CBB|nr:hypothetical protein [Streptomyces canus]MDQ1072502.1 hypothetical protein [Streptomyces canus]
MIGTASERELGAVPVIHGAGPAERVRAVAPDRADAALDICGRGEIPDSIELAGGPERVLPIAASDGAGTGIQIDTGSPLGTHVLRELLALIEQGRLRVPVTKTTASPDGRTAHSSSGNSPANAPAIRSQGSASSWRP